MNKVIFNLISFVIQKPTTIIFSKAFMISNELHKKVY